MTIPSSDQFWHVYTMIFKIRKERGKAFYSSEHSNVVPNTYTPTLFQGLTILKVENLLLTVTKVLHVLCLLFPLCRSTMIMSNCII